MLHYFTDCLPNGNDGPLGGGLGGDGDLGGGESWL